MQTYDQEPPWRSLHWTMLLFGLGSILRGAIFPMVVFGYAAKSWGLFLFILFTGVFLPLIAQVMKFLSMRYQVGMGRIRIREGIFSKKIRSIPVKRIHNINTSQSLPARLFNVLRLDIETAGGGNAEASFVALSRDAAMEIQEYVRIEKGRNEAGEVETSEEVSETVLFRISIRDILIAGATTNRMGLIMVGLGIVFQYWEEYAVEKTPQFVQAALEELKIQASAGGFHLFLMVAGLLLFFFLLAWVISIFTALVSWHRFTLSDAGDDLKIKTGLFTVRGFTMPRNKIQALRMKISPFRRPFSLMDIKVRSAGHVGMQEGQRVESDLLAPIARAGEANRFVQAVWPEADWDGVQWLPVHRYTRQRQFRILLSITAAATAVLGLTLNADPVKVPIMVILIGVPLMWLISHLTYKQTAYAVDQRFLYIKTGFLGLHFWVIPVGKIQNLALTQTPFQRNRSLASLQVDVAGGAQTISQPEVPNIPLSSAWRLFNRLGHPFPAVSVGGAKKKADDLQTASLLD